MEPTEGMLKYMNQEEADWYRSLPEEEHEKFRSNYAEKLIGKVPVSYDQFIILCVKAAMPMVHKEQRKAEKARRKAERAGRRSVGSGSGNWPSLAEKDGRNEEDDRP